MKNSSTFRCVCIGEASLLIQCSQQLLANGHDIVALVTDEAEYMAWGTDQNLTVIPFGSNLHAQLAEREFDYLFSIANLKILPKSLIALPKRGAFNFHDGPLPDYAGLYTTSWALINQEVQHGVTWHKIEAGIDTGEIVAQERFTLDRDETAFSLNVKCYAAGMRTFGQLLHDLEAGSLTLVPQSDESRTYFAKRRRPQHGGVLNWAQPAAQLEALVRGLDFGQTLNPLVMPKLLADETLFIVPKLKILNDQATATPGTVVDITRASVTLSTGSNDVQIPYLLSASGEEIDPTALLSLNLMAVGDQLPLPRGKEWDALERSITQAARDEAVWVARYENGLTDIELPYLSGTHLSHDSGSRKTVRTPLPAAGQDLGPLSLLAAFGLYLSRLSAQGHFHLRVEKGASNPLFAKSMPLMIAQDRQALVEVALSELETALLQIKERPGHFQDLFQRYPSLASNAGWADSLPLSIAFLLESAVAPPEAALALEIDREQNELIWHHDSSRLLQDDLQQMVNQFETFLEAALVDPKRSLATTPILSRPTVEKMIFEWNATEKTYPHEGCIHSFFVEQVIKTPEQTALVFQQQALTYAELDRLSNQVARHLLSLGVGPDQMIGVYMDRSLEMIVGLFGILKAGGAYLPLDPTYPAERLAFMVEDTQTPVILTQPAYLHALPPHNAQIVSLDLARGWEIFEGYSTELVASEVTSKHLAYVIYTSGSTGKPKGVMVEHRNGLNFFAGMDDRIKYQPGDTWLAVTSLSFDISVLEIFWSLTRGLRVVLYASRPAQVETARHARQIEFGLFYFSSDASEGSKVGKYDLLIEGAKYADKNGFSSVWTPERHFHAFGGLYPNPAVTGAAVAAVTNHVRIMAGSCVLPLHHPVRVAEEWSVVDNLSNGRVGISFAAGWQPNDFLLQPQNFEGRKNVMFDQIETVKKLWRGESVSFDGPNGAVVVETLPRPVQSELPIWVTAAGNPETFRMAGEGGFYILTHLLGQSVAEVGKKIALYREGWRKSGKPGGGHVSIMLHTFVGHDPDVVRELVREPLKAYLRSSVFLIKQASWSFPTFKEKASETGKSPLEIFETEDLSDEEMEALLEHAFDRYYRDSGLLGTPEKCREMVNDLQTIGVDELACQIDFGVSSSLVLNHLAYLNDLRRACNPEGLVVIGGRSSQPAKSIPELIKAYKVTHFQCTPSMMRMLLVDDEMRESLSQLKVCMLGGEALPRVLADEVLAGLGKRGSLINMYGPTETTIWSSTAEVEEDGSAITIGRPIANTALYIVDEQLQPVPVGQAGELLIGGDGVVRGYWGREQLTAERFILDPFKDDGESRLYRTGDLARFRSDGTVDFLGRLDFQVKIRGYRIELGEIEALLNKHVDVREAVVVAREDRPGDKRLVAYILGRDHFDDEGALRAHLKETLPDFMVPSHFLFMHAFPLTPNKKTDRKALPSPLTFRSNPSRQEPVRTSTDRISLATPKAVRSPVPTPKSSGSQTPLEGQIAAIWKELLGIDGIGRHDNFFDIGGHSILAVQAHRQMRDSLKVDLSIADLFRYATLAELGAFLGDQQTAVEQVQQQAQERASARRDAMAHRVKGRRRV
ncbi:MAG: MupA/Atu3671 family FMN-dependent luciferase-like monooxygenase [Chloroflexota bacterium]